MINSAESIHKVIKEKALRSVLRVTVDRFEPVTILINVQDTNLRAKVVRYMLDSILGLPSLKKVEVGY